MVKMMYARKKITLRKEELLYTKTEITNINNEKGILQTSLTKLLSEIADLVQSMKSSDDRLVKLITCSEVQTSLIQKAVLGEFDSYQSSIDQKKLENVAAVILDDKIEPHKQLVQNNGNPTPQKIIDFEIMIDKTASYRNGGVRLNPTQVNKRVY